MPRRTDATALSFARGVLEEEDDQIEPETTPPAPQVISVVRAAAPPAPAAGDAAADADAAAKVDAPPPAKRLCRNPLVDTTFLPNAEREAAEQAERLRLQAEWHAQQDVVKATSMRLVYSVWDGVGHRRVSTFPFGTTVGQFLAMAKRGFPNLARQPVGSLLFIKEDTIIPHDLSFYDLLVSKAVSTAGTSRGLRLVRDIGAATTGDALAHDEAHPAKIVERSWYERNKRRFPASQWVFLDVSTLSSSAAAVAAAAAAGTTA